MKCRKMQHSSGSALFAKDKTMLKERNTILFGKSIMSPDIERAQRAQFYAGCYL